jgi:uncharacterized membrane protein YphA (DoxX/SURF4 family)
MQSEEIEPVERMGWRTMAVVYAVSWIAGVQLIFWFGNLFKLRSMIESFVYPALILAVLAMPVVRGLWAKTGTAARCAAGGLVLLMINAQLLRRSDATFPVCAWTMYGAKKPIALQYPKLVAVRADGSRSPMNIDEQVSYTRPFVSLLSQALGDAEKIRTTDPVKAERILAELDGVLGELGRLQSQPDASAPWIRVELVSVKIGSRGEPLGEETQRSVAVNRPRGGLR